MSRELKPCPFCGGDAHIDTLGDDEYKAECFSCGIGTEYYQDKQKVIDAWNRRVQ